MNCPQCPGAALEERRFPYKDRSKPGGDAVLEAAVEACASCGGIWFDKDELDLYLDAKTACLGPAPGKGKAPPAGFMKCPRCAKVLEKRPAAGNPKVIVDFCASCQGLWLEAGEAEAAGNTDGVSFQDRMKSFFGGPAGA